MRFGPVSVFDKTQTPNAIYLPTLCVMRVPVPEGQKVFNNCCVTNAK